MKHILAVIAAAFVGLAASAQAATYWVAPDSTLGIGIGSPYRTGSDTSSAFPDGPTTLAWFNANAVAGDVCRFKSGEYANPINPTYNKDGLRYYGFPQDPTAVRVNGLQFGEDAGRGGSNCTARWVTTTTLAGILGTRYDPATTPDRDSIVRVIATNCVSLSVKGNYHVLDSLTVTGTVGGGAWCAITGFYRCDDCNGYCHLCCDNPTPVTTYVPAVSNQIKNSTFTVTKNSGSTNMQCFLFNAADSTIFFNNTLNATYGGGDGYWFGAEMYNSHYNLVQNSTWTFTMNANPTGTHAIWCSRDWTTNNRYFNNTVTSTGPGYISIMPTNSGSCGSTTGSNYYGNNVIKLANPQRGAFDFYEGVRGDTVEFNSVAVATTLPLVTIESNTDNTGGVIRQNTFMTAGATAVNLSGGTGDRSVATRLSANVYYCQTQNSASASNVKVVSPVEMDSAGVFFSLGASSPQYAIDYGSVRGVPGSGGNFGGSESVWGSPRFVDSTFTAADTTFDGRVTSAGFAIGAGWHDGFVGYGTYDPDVTAPVATITAPTDTARVWATYETMPLAWTATDAVGVVAISIDWGRGSSPSSWSTVVSGLSGATTSYNWSLPVFTTGYATFRIRALDLAGNTGIDTQVFRCNVSSSEGGPEREVP